MEWDAFVAAHPEGYHEQTSPYAAHRRDHGFIVDRAEVREGGTIIGGAQVLVQRTPLGKCARVYRAPLAKDNDPAILANVVHELDVLARRNGYVSLRVDTFPNQQHARRALREAGFTESRAWSGSSRSSTVSLEFSDDELLQRLPAKKSRYNVRYAERQGVEVREGTRADVDAFIALREMSVAHNGYQIFPAGFYRSIWDLFAPSRRLHLLIAHRGAQALAALVNLRMDERMYLVWIGTHRGEEERKLMAGYLLHYRAFVHARDAGCTMCDFLGTSEFKAKLTDETIEWDPPQRKFYGLLRGARARLMEFAWTRARLRRATNTVAHRLGLRPAMPY